MNVEIMMAELVKRLSAATCHLQFQTKRGEITGPQVFNGYMPPKDPRNPQREEDFPYVMPRYLNDESTDDDTVAQVKILCGVFSEDDQQGWMDLLNLTNCIKADLLQKRNFGDCFEIKMPFKREFPEEQTKPEWWGWFLVKISIPNIQEVDRDVIDFLSGR